MYQCLDHFPVLFHALRHEINIAWSNVQCAKSIWVVSFVVCPMYIIRYF